jgi:hypothetical protein
VDFKERKSTKKKEENLLLRVIPDPYTRGGRGDFCQTHGPEEKSYLPAKTLTFCGSLLKFD